jgi:DNA-binding CsgD family transcriptional regulator
MTSQRIGMLTGRERDVLALAGRGLTNQEIADDLFISARTVKCTLHRACIKLGAHNRMQAVIVAMRQGDLHILDMFSLDELANLLRSIPDEVLSAIYERAGRNATAGSLPSVITRHAKAGQNGERAKGGVECVC